MLREVKSQLVLDILAQVCMEAEPERILLQVVCTGRDPGEEE